MDLYIQVFLRILTEIYLNYSDAELAAGGGAAGIVFFSLMYMLFRRKPKKKSAQIAEEGLLQESELLRSREMAELEELEDEPQESAQEEPEDEEDIRVEEFEEPSETEPLLEKELQLQTEELEMEEVEPVEKEVEETKEGLFSRLRAGLSRTQAGFLGKLDEILSIRKEVDDNLWDDFEEALIMADLGVGTTMKLRQALESKLSKKSLKNTQAIKTNLKEEVLRILKKAQGRSISLTTKPFVIMVAGVNGVGKTTTIGKLAYKFRKDGKTVMVAAADTFRAAAVDQLEIWAKRVGSDFLRGQSGGDPSAVAFDAIKAAFARGTDVLIIDTAGRLHTKTNLMDELKKIKKVVARELEKAPHEMLLVLDATTGQNAVQQAKLFKEAIEVTGIVLTKLDGTAKGGVIVAIADELNIPVKFIGIGESLGDLREFNAEEFVEALFLTGKETLH